jgi:hypothetical protein
MLSTSEYIAALFAGFEFRYRDRIALGIGDMIAIAKSLKGMRGKRLMC